MLYRVMATTDEAVTFASLSFRSSPARQWDAEQSRVGSMGLWDLSRCEETGLLERVPPEPTMQEVHRLQASFAELGLQPFAGRGDWSPNGHTALR